jgi:aryl carrier-like protein
LQTIFSETLEKEGQAVDWDQSFIALGGDSILAIRVLVECQEAGLDVDVAQLMGSESLSELFKRLSAVIDASESSSDDDESPASQGGSNLSQTSLEDTDEVTTTVFQLSRYIEPGVVHDALHHATAKLNEVLENDLPSHHHHQNNNNHTNPSSWKLNFHHMSFLDYENGPQLDHAAPQHHINAYLISSPYGVQRLILSTLRSGPISQAWSLFLSSLDDHVHAQHGPVTSLPHGITNGKVEVNNAPRTVPESISVQVRLSQELSSDVMDGDCHRVLRSEASDLLQTTLLLALGDFLEARDLGIEVDLIQAISTTATGSQGNTSRDELRAWNLRARRERNPVDLLRQVKDAVRGFQIPRQHKLRTSGTATAHGHLTDHPTERETRLPLLVDVTGLHEARFQGKVLSELSGVINDCHLQQQSRHSLVMTSTVSAECLILTLSHGQINHPGVKVNIPALAEKLEASLVDLMSALGAAKFPIPTLSDFPALSLNYSGLEYLVQERLSSLTTSPLEDIEATFPCSRVQRNLHLSREIDPRKTHCCFIVRLYASKQHRTLSTDRLISAWNAVVARHPLLRTVIVDTSSKTNTHRLVQSTLKKFTPRVRIVEPGQEGALFTTQQYVELPPDEPQHLMTLMQTNAGNIQVRLDISHAIVDGQSADALVTDMASAYHGSLTPGGALGYDNFVRYEEELAASVRDDAFAKTYLQDAQPSILSSNRASDPQSTLVRQKFRLPLAEERVKALLRQHNLTISSICRLAWGLVLKTITRSESICFAYITSDRDAPLPGIQSAVGPFISTLPCKLNFGKDANVLEMLRELGADFLRVRKHDFTTQHLDDASDSARPAMAAWGDTMMTCQRKPQDENKSENSELGLEVIEAFSATDVSPVIISPSNCV